MMVKGLFVSVTVLALSGLVFANTRDNPTQTKSAVKASTVAKIAAAVHSAKTADHKIPTKSHTKAPSTVTTHPAIAPEENDEAEAEGEVKDSTMLPQGAKLVAGDPELEDFYIVGQSEPMPQFKTLATQREEKTTAFIAANPLPTKEDVKKPALATRYAANVKHKVADSVDKIAKKVVVADADVKQPAKQSHSEPVGIQVALNTDDVRPLVLINDGNDHLMQMAAESEGDFQTSSNILMFYLPLHARTAYPLNHAIAPPIPYVEVLKPVSARLSVKQRIPEINTATQTPVQQPFSVKTTMSVSTQPKTVLKHKVYALHGSPMLAALNKHIEKRAIIVMMGNDHANPRYEETPTLKTVLTKAVHKNRSPEYVEAILKNAIKSTNTAHHNEPKNLKAGAILHPQALKQAIRKPVKVTMHRSVKTSIHHSSIRKVAVKLTKHKVLSFKLHSVIARVKPKKIKPLQFHAVKKPVHIVKLAKANKHPVRVATRVKMIKIKVISVAEAEKAKRDALKPSKKRVAKKQSLATVASSFD